MSPPELHVPQLTDLLPKPANGSPLPSLSLPPLAVPAARSRRRGWGGRPVRYAALGVLVVGLGWGGITWGLPGRKAADVITAKAVRGNLVITTTDRGELESAKS